MLAGWAVPGASRTSCQLAVSVMASVGLPSFMDSRNDPVEDVKASTTNVRSSAAADTVRKVVRAGGVKVASVLPVTESPTTTLSRAMPCISSW
jgi:hypothetical protein